MKGVLRFSNLQLQLLLLYTWDDGCLLRKERGARAFNFVTCVCILQLKKMELSCSNRNPALLLLTLSL